MSLDGYIEGPNGEYDWCPPPNQQEMDEFMASIDTIFMGRKSFEMTGPSPFPGKEIVVFSNTISHKKVIVLGGDIVSAVKKLKQQSGKNIWLFGGASLTTSLLNAGLIDEIGLAIVPIVLGSGKPLFQNIYTAREVQSCLCCVQKRLCHVNTYFNPLTQSYEN